MSTSDVFALETLDKAIQGLRTIAIIGGGLGMFLADWYAGGVYYNSIYIFGEGPSFITTMGPWLVSLTTSGIQIFLFQWIVAYKRENRPKGPIEYIAFVGVALVMIWDLGADLGGATVLMYGDQYVENVIPTHITREWVIGAGVIVFISLFADPAIGYFVGKKRRTSANQAG